MDEWDWDLFLGGLAFLVVMVAAAILVGLVIGAVATWVF
jgi:hypothetical protein